MRRKIKNELIVWSRESFDPIDLLAIGPDRFYKYWMENPENPQKSHYKWHEYDMKNLAWAYFVVNVIAMVSRIHRTEEALWFPEQGKESRRVDVFGEVP